ncbi:TetR/AcrR family transcriptional regulator [Nocardioides luteus]|uniref:TetR/AcrR family transcriptional regulator n=1 Tax=Nocardioides luteus TaxID=1844 RepID=UPI0018C96EA2|nr:TetR/AcrR family transcriptional regulator [Nocardioides luteus]MBG6097914.1 AcrR family transcriptional regulator [Nocardioides luteus]
MSSLRSDAARSRAKILDTARQRPVTELRLNELARAAGVGVATVYRHFPTVDALVEALNLDALEQLVAQARTAAALPDPGEAFTTLVRSAALFQVEHEGLQAILLSEEVSPAARELREELLRLAETALESAVRNGVVRADVTTSHVQRLVCGVEHAVRLGDGTDRDLLLDVMLTGLSRHA